MSIKRRKDSFFGLHFDIHANPEDNVTIGATLSEEDIREICRVVRPDFIQIDCKGHPGWASYPSKLGNAMPSFSGDPLALWRRVTKEENVALYLHYSGIYDIKYASEHESSSAMDANGRVRVGFNRDFDKYADELLIPQISELAEVYGIDGVWIDGDSWAVVPDFREDSFAEFERETGISLGGKAPATPSDPYYYEYREYYKEKFRRYVRRYVDKLHERFPELQIASNWAYTDHMPEKVSSDVDFISGDLNPNNSFNSARYAARAIAHQGHTWDLMAWNFRFNVAVGAPDKHAAQLLQEAAAVISLGGGFQNYIMQQRDGSPNMPAIRRMTGLSRFMREREDCCFRGKPIHEAAMLLSTFDRAHEVAARVYSREGYEKQMGLCSLLCDAGQSLEIFFEHDISDALDGLSMIVVPELKFGLEEDTVRQLIGFAEKGGTLVLVGKRTCAFFAEKGIGFSTREMQEYKIDPTAQNDNGHAQRTDAFLPYTFTLEGNIGGALLSPCEITADNKDARILINAMSAEDKGDVAVMYDYGKGKIAAIGFDIGSQYLTHRQYLHKYLIKRISDKAYEPKARIELSCGSCEIVCLEKNGRLMLQIINANGCHTDASCMSEDTIPPLVNLTLSVKTENKDARVILRPEGRELECRYKNGRIYFDVDRVDIHSVAEVIE